MDFIGFLLIVGLIGLATGAILEGGADLYRFVSGAKKRSRREDVKVEPEP